jgi:chemotaxis protein methyltransferase CheR
MTVSQTELAYVRELVFRRSAIVIDDGKEYLVESRLAPLARSEGLPGIAELIVRLRTQPANTLHAKVVEAMTTNETSFFRDIHPFDALRTQLLPQLRSARAATKTLRIWSAACSTGQEAYSIAMTIREHFPALASWNVRIVGTDLSTAMVARAQQGTFNQIEVNRGMPAPLLVKYFERKGVQWRAKDCLRELIECKTMNLAEPWMGLPRCDIVFLRNVLIYFDVPTKRAILTRVKQILAPDGYLFLGGAETTLKLDDSFERVQVDKAVYYKVGGAQLCK